MKFFLGFIGWSLGMLLGFSILEACPILAYACIIGGIPFGRYIGGCIEKHKEEEKERARRIAAEREKQRREEIRRNERRIKAIELNRKYPEATKEYFKIHWGISKSSILPGDITDNRVDLLLSHSEYDYQNQEEKLNAVYKAKVERERLLARQEEERKRRKEEEAKRRKEEELRKLPDTLPHYVTSWHLHSNSTIRHKYFYDYYTYFTHKDYATSEMWNTWHTVWNFKNDPTKGISSYDHNIALDHVVGLVENALSSAFGSKTEYLTLVCLTASTRIKTELRFKEFSKRVCSDLKMNNAYSHITVVEDGVAKHDGGTGSHMVSYDIPYFNGKLVVLFDDVRTSGRSLETERIRLEGYGAKVICAITIAQTV